ncbi:M20 family metallopeptidase, partial [Candidatus Peregrinibacteria bacterium]|nr:M20 family metallopeptidase [Candidatus Peregrinibacteria bacterium]
MADLAGILKDIVAINSENPPGDCAAIAKYVVGFLRRNTKAKIDIHKLGNDKFNIVAKFGNPKIFINAHLDTVPTSSNWSSPRKLKKKQNKFFGLGTSDVKGAVSAMLFALQSYQPRNLLLFFNTDEEHGKNDGLKAFLESKYRGGLKYGIATEPTNLNVIILHNGICNFEISFLGKSAHASMPEKGINAIELCADFIARIKGYASGLSKREYCELKPSLNVGVIWGGTKPNMVPDRCILKIGRRFLPKENKQKVIREISKFAKGAGVKVTYFAPPLNIEMEDTPLIGLLQHCTARCNTSVANFWSEAALFTQAGLPTVVFGPGNIEQAHAPNEFIDEIELEKAAQIYK